MKQTLPERPDLGQLKKQAKDLLKEVRAALPAALARIGTEAGTAFALSDAQRVLAREYGFASWPKLKLHVTTREEAFATARLVQAVAQGDSAALAAVLQERPGLGAKSISAAAMLADLPALQALVARQPDAARARGGLCDTEALGYVCLGKLGGDEAARVACAKFLLDRGADPNATWRATDDKNLRLPILYSAVGWNNYPALARCLLAAGARPDDGESVFHAAEKNHRECLEALLAAGADIGGRDPKWKNTPLYFLHGWSPGAAPSRAARAGIVWLLEHGANPNVTATDHAETPLFPAVRNNWDLDLIRLMLDHGADPAARGADGRSLFSVAVKFGRADVAELLRSRGAVDDATPAEHFLGAIGDVRATEARRLLADHPGWVRELAGEITKLVVGAARRGDVRPATLAAELGFDIDQPGENAGRALHWAAWHGQIAVVRELVRLGADLNRRDGTFHAPPLGWCVHGSTTCRALTGDYGAVAEFFLAAGADRPPNGAEGGSREVHAVFARFPA